MAKKRAKDGNKEDVFEIRIPHLWPDEVEYVRNEVCKFAKNLINELAKARRQRN